MKSRFIQYIIIALLFVLSATSHPLFSQTKVKFKVYTNDKNAIVKFEHQKVKQREMLETDTGTYTFTVWAPNRQLVTKKVSLNDTSRFSIVKIKLPLTEDYVTYKKKRFIYKYKRFTLNYLPTGAYAIYTGYNLIEINKLNDDAKRFKTNANKFKEQYENSFWLEDIENNRNLFNQNKENYNKAIDDVNNKWRAVKISTVAAVGIIYYTKRLAKKLTKPTYSETPLLSRVQVVPIFLPENKQVLFTLNF